LLFPAGGVPLMVFDVVAGRDLNESAPGPSRGLHRNRSPDAVSASHVAPMIVVAAIPRIKIPIATH
jgi:hypothetical protein